MGGYDARNQKFVGDQWPKELGDSYKNFIIDFQEQTHGVLLKLLRGIALGLGWPEDFFEEVQLPRLIPRNRHDYTSRMR